MSLPVRGVPDQKRGRGVDPGAPPTPTDASRQRQANAVEGNAAEVTSAWERSMCETWACTGEEKGSVSCLARCGGARGFGHRALSSANCRESSELFESKMMIEARYPTEDRPNDLGPLQTARLTYKRQRRSRLGPTHRSSFRATVVNSERLII